MLLHLRPRWGSITGADAHLVRQRVRRTSPITGEPEEYVATVQTSSLYSFSRPAAYADHLTLPGWPASTVPVASTAQHA